MISTVIFVCAVTSNVNSQNLAGITTIQLPSIQTPGFIPDNQTTKSAGLAKELRRNEINSQAMRNFFGQHQNVQNARWFKAGDDLIMVSFTIDGILHWIHYNNNGDKEFMIRFLDEKKLPRQVRHLIKSNYYDFNITHVREISRKDKTAFVVNIEDQSSWKIINLVDGEMEVVESFLKK